jgi:AcrR family transcriptional regulator
MIHIVKQKNEYNSPLRQNQMQRTRSQILDGLLKAMTHGGLAQLSIPAVAREAGVSVPTVYRYFRTKQELIDALSGHLLQKVNVPRDARAPQSPQELEEMAKKLFEMYEGLDEVTRAAITSGASFELRKDILAARLAMIEQALSPVASQFDEPDRIHLRNMITILCSTAMARNFSDYLGLTGTDAAETVAWTIRTLVNAHAHDGTKRTEEV